MKILNLTFVILFMFVTSVYAGEKETIIEKIEKVNTVPVFFPQGRVNVKQPTPNAAATPLYPEEVTAFKKPVRDFDLPDDYNIIHDLIVSELNKAFGTDKFVAGNLEDVPTKDVKILGMDTVVADWLKLEEKFIVLCFIDGLYSASTYERNKEERLQIKTKYIASINVKFCDIVEKNLPLKYLNPIGVMISASSEGFIQDGYFTKMDQFTSMVAPNSLAEKLKSYVPGGFDKFYEKQKKKYDKAMKKKK